SEAPKVKQSHDLIPLRESRPRIPTSQFARSLPRSSQLRSSHDPFDVQFWRPSQLHFRQFFVFISQLLAGLRSNLTTSDSVQIAALISFHLPHSDRRLSKGSSFCP
uniref:Uncharacterized protein n=1 Tax=Cucumis melo TaxID=3656 RepID=A0A9I9EJE1_CUCME